MSSINGWYHKYTCLTLLTAVVIVIGLFYFSCSPTACCVAVALACVRLFTELCVSGHVVVGVACPM